ncbi:MAG: hypothetical protein A3H35_15115 [Betaproteobacteria bacterium RIFCSPLOWO2_02_FULL_62_17]|nr:MAG: hypothetical protein A3H35_15115 [Betaproteobacteria bacterium RIFCSPLOWO2_02_FULL_62_17]
MSTATRDAYLVGTIPLDHIYQVFNTVSELLGENIRRVPDGELGDRKMWVSSQYPVLGASPALEVGEFPSGGVARSTSYEVPLRLRANADPSKIAFGDLNFARWAITSYGVLRALKDAGKVPRSWRLQVGLPAPQDVMSLLIPESRAPVETPYECALLAELARIQAAIPHGELAITWDAVRVVLIWEDPENAYVRPWWRDAKPGIVERLVRLGNAVAPGVEMGYHLCYGSQDHSHAINPRDLGACVEIANAVAQGLNRRIDYVHMPVPRDRSDDAYFAPLGKLDRDKSGRVYLGLVHYTDGVEGARRRIAAAERFLPDFGIATECGFGRRPGHQDVRRLIQLHAQILQ